jgi:lysophospholipase L1-like esterase
VVAVLLVAVPSVRSAADPAASGAATSVGAAATADACSGDHWVGAWASPPQSSSLGKPDDHPLGLVDGEARTFDDQTVRIVVVPKAAGSALRVRLSNRFGPSAVTFGAATVGARASGAELVSGSVRALTFAGAASVTVPSGAEVVSDPVAMPVRAFAALAVSVHVSGPAPLDFHQWAAATHFVTAPGAGDHTADETATPFVERVTSTFAVTGVDVLAPRAVGAVVTLGDSITDGVGSTSDLDRRWPDALARRVAPLGLSVVNAGMGGNHVVVDGNVRPDAVGPAAVDRFALDVVAVPGATDVILFEGTNDLGNADPSVDTAANVIAGYRSIITQARAAGLRVIGATITPADRTDFREDLRHRVNEWIRTSGELDAVVDFDAVVRDPARPWTVRDGLYAGFAHLTDEGYAVLAAAIEPSIFQGTGC